MDENYGAVETSFLFCVVVVVLRGIHYFRKRAQVGEGGEREASRLLMTVAPGKGLGLRILRS